MSISDGMAHLLKVFIGVEEIEIRIGERLLS
jgi:hypothetical protein